MICPHARSRRPRASPASTSTSIDIVEIHQRAGLVTPVFAAGVAGDQWSASTNCDMDVRVLVNHLVSGNLWAVRLIAGKTIAEVGSKLDGDVLAENPLAAYDGTLSAAQSAFSGPAVLERTAMLHASGVRPTGQCARGLRCANTFAGYARPRQPAMRVLITCVPGYGHLSPASATCERSATPATV